jgi:hypothetical protein
MTLFSCSGPGAPEAIARSIEIGYTHAAIAGGLLVISLALFAIGPRRWIVPAILLGLVAFHPAWTISAISGDCGSLKEIASLVFTGFGALAVFAQGFRWLRTAATPNSEELQALGKRTDRAENSSGV